MRRRLAHFSSKQELELELLRTAERLFDREVLQPALAAPPGLPRLRAFFRRWLGWAPRAGLPGGCPHAAAVFESDDVNGPVRDYLVAGTNALGALVEGLVGAAAELGHLPSDVDAGQLAWELRGIYLTHHVAQRLMHDPGADRRARVAFDALVSR